MTLNPTEFSYAFAAGALAIAFATFFVQSSAQRRLRLSLQKMEKAVAIANAGAVGMGQRMLALEARLAAMQSRVPQRKTEDEDFSFSRARELIRAGLTDDVISTSCGLTPSEIHLMRMMQNSGRYQDVA